MVKIRSLISGALASVLLIALLTVTSHVGRAFASSIGHCQETQLDVKVTPGGVATGHINEYIVITNVSANACTVSGYPTVRMSGAANIVASVAKKTQNGFMGGLGEPGTVLRLPVVTLRSHGATASSMVEGEDNPVGNAVECVIYSKVTVTLPGLSPPYRFTSKFPGCIRPQVHPIVKGSRGTATK